VKILYDIDFYRSSNGCSDVLDYIKKLYEKSATSKTDRINHQKIVGYMKLLRDEGVSIGEPVVKPLGDGLYELRPLSNRIIFFFFDNNKYVILSHFIKKTEKTPTKEIDKAKRRRTKYIENGGNSNEKHK
jgi:phage-related protein